MSRLSRPRYQRRKTRGFTTRDVGDEIRRAISRGQYRRELATGVSTKFNGVTLDSYSYSYDALSPRSLRLCVRQFPRRSDATRLAHPLFYFWNFWMLMLPFPFSGCILV